MPNLPTIEVTEAQAERLFAVFGDVQTYRRWLRERLVEHVRAHDLLAVRADVEEYRLQKVADLTSVLPEETP